MRAKELGPEPAKKKAATDSWPTAPNSQPTTARSWSYLGTPLVLRTQGIFATSVESHCSSKGPADAQEIPGPDPAGGN